MYNKNIYNNIFNIYNNVFKIYNNIFNNLFNNI